ncbi:hypothetical protein D9613_001120 [Agrocybe pediades]|uniref:Uncharacterized protein n=1 Tax=Agrocybe pediades TaxID=84607 RepID=A0A8H4R178_9AGAR|nr:hypothetical protein D9613_001120 [Agrocybe pediades]
MPKYLESKYLSLSFYWADPNDKIVKIFSTIQNRAKNMQELDFGTLRDYAQARECTSLSHLVCLMTDLRCLSCAERVLTPPAIRHLATLPNLRALEIPNTAKSILSGTSGTTVGVYRTPTCTCTCISSSSSSSSGSTAVIVTVWPTWPYLHHFESNSAHKRNRVWLQQLIQAASKPMISKKWVSHMT